MLLAMNTYARRHTAESRFSHFAGDEAELLSLVVAAMEEEDWEPSISNGEPMDGVVLVNVPPIGFFSGVVEVTHETELVATFGSRFPGEAPYIQVQAVGEKLPAHAVQVCIYRHDILGDEASTDAEWEIVSINARPTLAPEPPTPMAMARNMLGMEGGTQREYSAEDFAKAIVYWSTRAMRA